MNTESLPLGPFGISPPTQRYMSGLNLSLKVSEWESEWESEWVSE